MREVYTVRDVAQRLHLTTETVRDYLQEGKLKGFKVGKQWRVREQDLEAFIEALLQKSDGWAGGGVRRGIWLHALLMSPARRW
jgi:excisionase family DNA binding protein